MGTEECQRPFSVRLINSKKFVPNCPSVTSGGCSCGMILCWLSFFSDLHFRGAEMPIQRTLELRSISNDEFARIDAAVMKFAYATQNHFGRLFDERVYENHLASLLRAAGFSVQTQVPVRLTHADFEKTYILDLVVDEMLYELKVVSTMTTAHEVQVLNYAMLQDIP